MGQLLIIKCSWFKDNDELGWHYPRWLASRYTLVLHGFVVHESYVLCVLTNRVALLTANHSSLLHSLSYPEERCRGRTAFFFFFFLKKQKRKIRFLYLFPFLSDVKMVHSLMIHPLSFFLLLAFVHSTDVPKNFTVKWATKSTVVIAWKFSESRSPYKCTVSIML